MPMMSRAILKTMSQHGYPSKRLIKALDISPCDLKDWQSGAHGYVVRGQESVENFLAGFSEADIAKSSRWSCIYAIYIKKARFPMGEPAMKRAEINWWWTYYNQEMKKINARGRQLALHAEDSI
jgi:hypothetical protein